MIAPRLKALFSAALEPPALPTDPASCRVEFQALIGPGDTAEETMFAFEVVTPAYLAQHSLPRWGRGLLVVDQFAWPAVERALAGLLVNAQRESWPQAVDALRHDLLWEHDSHRSPAGA